MRANRALCVGLLLVLGAAISGTARSAPQRLTITGYVLDSACAFTKNLKKPVSRACAVACARAGSPLVILADDGYVYWPISSSTPARGQNARLMQFAGKRVTVSGRVYQRGGSRAIVIEKIATEGGST
jgi:hypothetical protein